MNEEILVNVTAHETRVALVEHGMLQELYVERSRKRGRVGHIFKGRVTRVLPGMQAAFVDIGLERTAFLHAADIVTGVIDGTDVSITHLLRAGQEILVQVAKDACGGKGARLTTRITIPSRYLVATPYGNGVGISAKIEHAEDRTRLKSLMEAMLDQHSACGYIVRTAAESAAAAIIQRDAAYLSRLWLSIREHERHAAPGSLLYEDLPLALRVLRDLLRDEVERIRIDCRIAYAQAVEFAENYIPEAAQRIEYYSGPRPIFDVFGIEDEIHKALERKIALKSGGYLIIDQTEALTVIDVNTGGFVGSRNLEETSYKTNLEAAQSIARQARLRNLAGIIIIDFIDMADAEHKRQVLRTLERSLQHDHVKTHISTISALGLVELTRKRTRDSLQHILCDPCPTCNGRGVLRSMETVCYDIFRDIRRTAHQYEMRELLVLAAEPVVDLLIQEESARIADLETTLGKPIRFRAEALYHQEQYDIVLM